MYRPIGTPLAKLPRAVERIDDPDATFCKPRAVRGFFFRQDGIIGPRDRKGLHDECVGDAIACASEQFTVEQIAPLQREQQIACDLRYAPRERGIIERLCRSRHAQPDVSSK